jgi:uncharacterized membrane protein
VRTLWRVVILLASIGIIGTTARALVLLFQPDFGDALVARHPEWGIANADDVRFARHAGPTLAHVISSFVFVVLGPWQFVPRIRSKRLWLHRWSGRIFVAAATVVGISGLLLGFTTALEFGGASETAPILLFAPIFLFSLGKAVFHILRREIAQHREWMIRVFAIGLAAGTDRLVGLPFILSPVVRQAPGEFIGITFWIAFTLNLLAAEIWIRHTRPKGTFDPPAIQPAHSN